MKWTNENITIFQDLDLELYFSVEVLKLKSLHYGYWEKGDKLDMGGLRKAQLRYSKTLLKLIPGSVKTVLDVGAGIGDNAKLLSEKGFIVTAISPDVNHEKFFDDSNNLKFVHTTFESFESKEKFDLILMSESQNYFNPGVGFAQCQKYLKQEGFLLVSGKFRRTKSREFYNITNVEGDYLRLAARCGFILKKSVDITDKILPTLQLAQGFYQQYGVPILRLFDYYFVKRPSLLVRVLKIPFRLFLLFYAKRVDKLHNFYRDHLDPEYFRKHICYKRFLFQYNPE